MAYITPNSIRFAAIARAVGPTDTRLRTNDERELHFAYLGNLAAAKQLGDPAVGIYQDAWLSLNLAVECFLKHLYCLVREEVERHSKPTRKVWLAPMEYDGGFLFHHPKVRDGQNMAIRDFDHEVMNLWFLLDKFTDANASAEFQDLKNSIPTKSDWIATRYARRNHPGFKTKFEDYLRRFELTLNSVFGSYK